MALDYRISDQVFQAVDQAGQAFALNFATGNGLTTVMEVVGLGVGLELIAIFLIVLTSSGASALQRATETVVYVAIVSGLIYGWGSLVAPLPIAMADELVTIVSGGQSAAGLASSMSLQFFDAMNHVIGTLHPSQQPIAAPAATGGSQTLWEQLGQWWDSNPVSSVFVGIADGIASSLISIGVVALLVACFAAVFMSLLTANILIYVGLCLGPFLLALGTIGRLRGLVNNWISFMLGAIFLKPILALLVGLAMVILQMINTIAAQNPSSQTPQMLIMLFTAMLSACILLLIQSAPSISSSLFGGISDKLSGMPSPVTAITNRINGGGSGGGGGGGGGGGPKGPASGPKTPNVDAIKRATGQFAKKNGDQSWFYKD